MTSAQDIDLLDPRLTPSEHAMLKDLMKAGADYCHQGRGREYHAINKALAIVWHYTRRTGGQPDLPRTDFGALDLPLPLEEQRRTTAGTATSAATVATAAAAAAAAAARPVDATAPRPRAASFSFTANARDDRAVPETFSLSR